MTDVTVTVLMTPWDVIASALSDTDFWVLSLVLVVMFSLWIRHRYNKSSRRS